MVVFSVSTRVRRAVALLLVVGPAACAPTLRGAGDALRRLPTPPAVIDDGDRAGLATAVGESARYFARLPPDRTVAFGAATRTAGEMRAAMESFASYLAATPPATDLAAEIARRFEVYRATPPEPVLFTGYYLPTLAARTRREAGFVVPVLGRPGDLVTVALADFGAPCACREQLAGRVAGGALAPYFTRAEIDGGAASTAPVLAWVDDPVGLFFMQIQGSGVLTFPSGERRTIGFAASNGRPYTSIGRVLIDRGAFDVAHASMDDIRRWIAAHPNEATSLLASNARYVFFRTLDGPPLGSLGVAVTAGRSIATDPAVFPPGALALIDVPPTGASPALTRLVVNQDAGAAIRGPGRVDVYFGAGDDAAAIAGRLRSPGALYFLAPRASATRTATQPRG